MSLDGVKTAALGIVREHIGLVEPLVFAMGFAEGIPGLSLLVPSTPLFLAIGGLHSAAGGGFVPVWLAASVGAVLGDVVVYALARRFKDDLIRLPLFRRYPGWLCQGRRVVDDWGALAVIGGKFLGVLRPFIPAVAGALEMPLYKFLPASIGSSLAWAGVFLGPGYGVALLF